MRTHILNHANMVQTIAICIGSEVLGTTLSISTTAIMYAVSRLYAEVQGNLTISHFHRPLLCSILQREKEEGRGNDRGMRETEP